LINSQKFIWETYKILLDLTKTNSKLLSLYAQILKSAFNFCKENRRKVEFKRLCDSVRGYLQTLIKTEKKQFFQNKVQISRPEVLKILIQIRISLLDTATELEQWQEAFKTAEDIIFLMDKYEKQISDDKSKKTIKIPPLMKLEFFHNIEKLLWISDYHLYHAHATILVKELAAKAEKWIKGAKNVEKLKDAKQKLEKFDIENVNNKIILSTLVTPFKNTYTNYLNVGSELFEYEREIETQTCSRMMGILKLSVVPSRKNLINFIQSNKLLDELTVDPKIKSLYHLLIDEKNPLVIGKNSFEIINYLRNNEKFAKFADLIAKNLLIRGLNLLSKNYDSITISRLEKIFPFVKANEQQSAHLDIQDIISESSRTGIFSCTIDIARNLIKFKSASSTLNKFNDTLSSFISSVASVTSKIIKSNKSNENKFSSIRSVIYKDIHSHNTNSLYIYDNLISSMDQTSQKLDLHLREKEKFKETLRETQAKIRKEEKEKAEEEAKMMREILKDEQKKKEFDVQLKKYLIDRIRIYTNVLFIEGKKVKLDDLLKDLNKISDEQLIKLLEKEEYEFKTKKEKKFKQTAKDTDYIIREFRKRDFDVYMKTTLDEEQKYNQLVEEEEKKSYTEKIGFKANLIRFKNYKDGYINDILTNREKEYEEKMQEFTQSLYKKIQDDLLKEIGPVFKTYVDDFRKRQEEDQVRQGTAWKPSAGKEMFMKKGGNFVKTDDKPRSTLLSGFGEFKSKISKENF
jgi:translation initiation factor 3 subunit A